MNFKGPSIDNKLEVQGENMNRQRYHKIYVLWHPLESQNKAPSIDFKLEVQGAENVETKYNKNLLRVQIRRARG